MSGYRPAEFWEQILARDFNLVGVGHGGYGPRYNSWLYRAKLRAFREVLRQAELKPSGAEVLDAGSGTGYFVGLYLKLDARVRGIDISRTAVSALRSRYPGVAFQEADLAALPFADGEFDLVHCFDVIYHVAAEERFQAALDELARVTKPGGTVLLVDSFGRRELSPRLEIASQVPHVRFRPWSAYADWAARWRLQRLAVVPMYFLLNRPIVGNVPPWTWHRVSWHLRNTLCEANSVGNALYALDSILRHLRWNSSLRVIALRRPAD